MGTVVVPKDAQSNSLMPDRTTLNASAKLLTDNFVPSDAMYEQRR
jgi:hypothetical protein